MHFTPEHMMAEPTEFGSSMAARVAEAMYGSGNVRDTSAIRMTAHGSATPVPDAASIRRNRDQVRCERDTARSDLHILQTKFDKMNRTVLSLRAERDDALRRLADVEAELASVKQERDEAFSRLSLATGAVAEQTEQLRDAVSRMTINDGTNW